MPDESAQLPGQRAAAHEDGPDVASLPLSIPWQRRREYPSSARAMWETIKLVLHEPSRAFFNVRVARARGEALLYTLLCLCTLLRSTQHLVCDGRDL